MKKLFVLGLVLLAAGWFASQKNAFAGSVPDLWVGIQAPAGQLKMGQVPRFTGWVTNVGKTKLQGLVVYLSLVSLEPGHEHPVDLEDWSAQKAIRIDQLASGASNRQTWPMRLIQAGKFGVSLTAVAPGESRPVVSELVNFNVQPKAMLLSSRIIPVAVGVPLLLLAGLLLLYWSAARGRRPLGKTLG
jgi:hypothetical protein